MSEQNYNVEDEINLIDVYEFLRDGWKILLATTVVGGVIGIGTAFILPEKYEASASIQPYRVLGEEIESINILAEKMRSPTYYSSNTLDTCRVSAEENAATKLAKELKPTVAKNSAFVSVSFKSNDTKVSKACLEAVLADVSLNQKDVAERKIALANSTLNKEKEQLKIAEDFLTAISNKTLTFDFKDTQFSASQLLLATLQQKQNEITSLKSSIQRTEILLTEPQTKKASFATPIYSPSTKVEPKRSLIAVISILAGGFFGLGILLAKKMIAQLKKHKKR